MKWASPNNLILIFALTLFLAQTGLVAMPRDVTKGSEFSTAHGFTVRTLHFPATSLGALTLVRPFDDYDLDGAPRVGIAENTVTVKVPKAVQLCLELNANIFRHPELLQGANLSGLDRIKVTFNTLNDQRHITDRVLQCLPPSANVICLDLHTADVTDEGLKAATKFPHLKDLNVSHCELSGESLATISKLPELSQLTLWGCPLKDRYLTALNDSKCLRTINLGMTGLTDEALKNFQPPAVEKLMLEDDKQITDKSVPYLLRLHSLRWLDIQSASLTMTGVEKLAPLHLNLIQLPFKQCSKSQLEALYKCFGANHFALGAKPKVQDWQRDLFRPLK